MISETRCRAKLFKHAQRQSRDGRFFLLLGGSDQLVGSQITRLSSLGVVILSEVLSHGFDLNSPVVRNLLRGWIARSDTAAVWMTQPLALSTASCLLETCQQANVAGFFAERQKQHDSSAFRALCRQSLCVSASAGGCVCFLLTDQETFLRCSLSTFRFT